MQLVAYGAQDVFLTGNPSISFFKIVYRRHTNFAIEAIEQTFNGTVNFGNKITTTISRNGDLITNCWLEVIVSGVDTSHLVNSFGHAFIEYVELEIGGQRIDKHYGEYLEILTEHTLPEEKRSGFKEMIGIREATGSNFELQPTQDPNTSANAKFYIPLQFFFNRNPGLALPLIALQYHEVKLNLKIRDHRELHNRDQSTTGTFDNASLSVRMYVDYVYLDTDERRRYAQMSHEYLIEQLQHTGPETCSENNHRLNFNHPVKELIWVVREKHENVAGKGPVDFGGSAFVTDSYNVDNPYSTASSDVFETCKLQLNGHDRFSEREASYFRLVQPYQHHTRIPRKYIYSYSFALNPESHQPSGSCNFSRLDNVTLILSGLRQLSGQQSDGASTGNELLVYAVNYNVLRIMSGMGGLAYSN